MRHQDRLLRSLSHPDLHFRAFLARQMERLVIHFDSEDLIAAVRAAWHDAPGPMAVHFLCAFNDLLPRHLRAAYSPGRSPVQSQMISTARSKIGERGRPEGRDALQRSATQILEPCIRALLARTGQATGRERRVLLTTAARFHHGAVEAFLVDRLSDDADGPLAAFLLTACFGVLDDRKLLARLDTLWDSETLPQYMLALRYMPTDGAFAFLERSVRHKSPAVQWLTAACLDRFGRFSVLPLVEDLFEGQFGWAVAHALESLGRIGLTTSGMPLVRQAIEKFGHPLVRASALRALVPLGAAEEGVEFCLREIEAPVSSQTLAQAIASLLQLGASAEVRQQVLTPRLKNQSLEVTTQAVLGLIGADDKLAGRTLRDMVVEGGEDERVQAAYCLGYYRGDSSMRVLEHLVRTDPSPAVRLQALRAFAYYGSSDASTGRLASFLELDDERLVMDAVRILSAPANVQDSEAAASIGAVARYGSSGPLRRLANRALSRFEVKVARAYMEETIGNRNADPDALLGAVEGMAWVEPPAPAPEGLRALLEHPIAPVRATAARVLFSWGDPSGLPALTAMMSGSGSEAREACKALEEIATVVDYLLSDPRFVPLSELLRANMKTAEYLDFSRRELGLTAAPLEPEPAVDPHAAVLSMSRWQPDDLGGQTAGHLVADIEEARRKYPQERPKRRTRPATEALPAVLGPEDKVGPPRSRKPWAVGAIGVVLGVVLFGSLGWLRGGREESPLTSGPSASTAMAPIGTALTVEAVRGVVRVERTGGTSAEIAGTETRVEPGQRVAADKGATVRFGCGPGGNFLVLQGEGAFVFGGLEVESQERRTVVVRAAVQSGQLVFDFKWGRPRVEAEAGAIHLKGWKGRFALSAGKDSITVKVASGRVEVTEAGGQYTLVAEGQRWDLKGKETRGQVTGFDPASESWR